MGRTYWGLHGECIRCGAESTHWFVKGWFVGRQRLSYCKTCLLKRLKEERIETRAIDK